MGDKDKQTTATPPRAIVVEVAKPKSLAEILSEDPKVGPHFLAINKAMQAMQGAPRECDALRTIMSTITPRVQTLLTIESEAREAARQHKDKILRDSWEKLPKEARDAIGGIEGYLAALSGPAPRAQRIAGSRAPGSDTKTAEYLAIADAIFKAQGERGSVNLGQVRKEFLARHPDEECNPSALWQVMNRARPGYLPKNVK